MQADDIRRVLIVGSGTMGLQIGLQGATHGYDVALYDANDDARAAAPRRLRHYGEAHIAAGLIDASDLDESLARISIHADPGSAAADVDLVSECLPEDARLKGSVLGQFNRLCPARAIFATNTSVLLPSWFAAATGRGDRFAALHFHNNVWLANVVEVMPHPKTSPETLEVLVGFARRIGQIPIQMRKESAGYVFNAMYTVINHTAISLVANGIASFEDVDRAWIGIFKMPIGPFGLLDSIGLDTVWQITDYGARKTGDFQVKKNAAFIKGFIDRGCLGEKSGEGFYRYPHPAYEEPGFVTGHAGGEHGAIQ
jgi:3-hydroxybutyryl-CoA dehydrogenase